MVVRQKDNGGREALLSIVVTGAAMGIGKSVALRLARDSRALVLVDVAEEALAKLLAEPGHANQSAHRSEGSGGGAGEQNARGEAPAGRLFVRFPRLGAPARNSVRA